jgi:uncharacterized circularly permuted ATP-grasp superfamily protein
MSKNLITLGLILSSFTAPPVYAAAPRCADLFKQSSTREADVLNKNFSYVRTKSSNGKVKETLTPAENLNFGQKLPAPLQKIYDHFFAQDPAKMEERINRMTQIYGAEMGMGFNKKSEKGDATIPFYVRVNPTPVFIPESYHNALVSASAPMMRSMRAILQLFYSKKNVTVADLRKIAVPGTPDSALEAFRTYVYENMYFERALISPSMKDYPFASVAGIDHAMTTLSKMLPLAYEINGGTPSGLSNTKQILELFKKEFPEYAQTLEQYLADDNTYINFAEVLSDLGKSWTGRDGISVVISPGLYNGAHPDVVSIAELSGNRIQLVNASDLYVDKDGWLRLNLGEGKEHPLVTTIYSRMEESALYSNMDQKKYGDGIGFKNPHLITKEKLAEIQASSKNLRKGAQLKEGIQYDFIKDEGGNIIDVNTDSKGNPKIVTYVDSKLGKDPTRDANSQPEPDLISLLQNHRVVLTNVGGRTLDIKPLFALMADYFAPNFNWEKLPALLGPAKTLKTTEKDEALRKAEYDKFFANPRGYVEKVAAESGGQGVYIGPQLSEAELNYVIELVRQDMAHSYPQLTIQEFLTTAVFTTVFNVDGKPRWASAIPDFRLFLYQDSAGRVKSGSTAYLGRNGGFGSASANTSLGGQYFLPTTVKDKPSAPKAKKVSTVRAQMTVSDLRALNLYIGNIGEIKHIVRQTQNAEALKAKLTTPGNGMEEMTKRAYYQGRAVMHVLGPKYRYYLSVLEGFQNGTVSAEMFRYKTETFIRQLQTETNFPYEGVNAVVKHWIDDWVTYN